MYLKGLVYLVIFSILHFGYELTQWSWLTPLCGVNESVFQHLKMSFWAYIFTSLIEYALVRKRYTEKGCFFYSRMLSAVILPWITALIWYIVPGIFGRIESLSLEVLWAVVSTYFSCVSVIIIEQNLNERFEAGFRVVVLILFVVSAILYVWFTYKLPWIDLFVNPELL